ncbi:hypothetical protein E2C01_041278 [Portunus trituberculatus]|uniref:Uncharacterized protein n=1 Tax=Portunus trituberculatus TaxID=210409 RepID=A0A5B7FQI4_PORTR|nr:hypothetical protein [Portunus trituberculatus]
MTKTSLSRRLTRHLKNEAIHEHYNKHYQRAPTRHDLVTGTTALDKEKEKLRLTLLEATYIVQKKLSMNHQTRDLQVLPTLKRVNALTTIQSQDPLNNPNADLSITIPI